MNRHMNARSLNSSWRLALLLLLALWLTTGWQHRETLLAMTAIWDRSATFTHAWLVPPIALWLMWTRRGQALAHVPAPSLLALPGRLQSRQPRGHGAGSRLGSGVRVR